MVHFLLPCLIPWVHFLLSFTIEWSIFYWVDDLSVKDGDFHHRYAAMLPAESPPDNSGSTRSSDLSAEQLSPAPKGVEVVDPDSAGTAFLPKKLG